ncbi:MAG: acyl-CoA carboxylase subunit beta [Deltaproteobacteria bacterium]|nr:acyl-CoA carboxylase subunit beta [Deltaproteobacteria bacterium]
MPVLTTRVDPRHEDFVRNHGQMLALVEQFRELEAKVRTHSARKADKFHGRGQLLPRERVDRILDRGTPFLELSTLAGYKMHDDDGKRSISGGSNIIGIGFVQGRRCLVSASDSAIKGGAVSPMGLRKSLRAQEVALDNRLPCINLVESAGANLLYQSELFVEGGRIFANMARLSAAGLPQITVVHGSSTAGGAYIPGLSDYVIVVKDRSKIFLAGPPLVKAALGEDADDETLGGAQMHMTVSGTAEYMASDDAHALQIAREVLGKLPWDEHHPVPGPGAPSKPPRYDAEELLGLVPVDYRQPYDVHEVIARIVDDSDFLDFKARYGPQTVCGHARIEGQAVGIIGNNGPIFPQGAAKAGHFIQACCQSGTPIVYLQNTTGYMVGTEAETNGIVKHGSKMIQAVANATVPQLTVLLGGSFGAGNYGMCGRSFDPRFIFAWPNARISVMGGEQAAKVMEIITRAKFARQGVHIDDENMAKMTGGIRDKLDSESDALFATARLWDDGVIDPRDTRRVLATTLAICREGQARTLRPNTFGVARL